MPINIPFVSCGLPRKMGLDHVYKYVHSRTYAAPACQVQKSPSYQYIINMKFKRPHLRVEQPESMFAEGNARWY